MYWVYVLKSQKDNKYYTGYTKNLKERITKHNNGSVASTQNRGKHELIYVEGCLNQTDAIRREKYLKSGLGKKYLRYRLKFWIKEPWPE